MNELVESDWLWLGLQVAELVLIGLACGLIGLGLLRQAKWAAEVLDRLKPIDPALSNPGEAPLPDDPVDPVVDVEEASEQGPSLQYVPNKGFVVRDDNSSDIGGGGLAGPPVQPTSSALRQTQRQPHPHSKPPLHSQSPPKSQTSPQLRQDEPSASRSVEPEERELLNQYNSLVDADASGEPLTEFEQRWRPSGMGGTKPEQLVATDGGALWRISGGEELGPRFAYILPSEKMIRKWGVISKENDGVALRDALEGFYQLKPGSKLHVERAATVAVDGHSYGRLTPGILSGA